MRSIRWILILVCAAPMLICVPFLFGFGFKSLSSGRNEGVVGIIQGFDQTDYNHCYVNVTFATKDQLEEEVTGTVRVPCQPERKNLKIPLCYNHHNPLNFAYDDQGQHAVDTDVGTENPWGFCSEVGYSSAKAMVKAGYVLLAVGGSIILIIIIVSIVTSRQRHTFNKSYF